VAADGYQSPAVVVSYTGDSQIQNGTRFEDAGIQIAAGVPLQCDEPENFSSFRIGLFGLDKLTHLDRTLELFDAGLQQVLS
jgi:aspartate aminotransferase-like enzyme